MLHYECNAVQEDLMQRLNLTVGELPTVLFVKRFGAPIINALVQSKKAYPVPEGGRWLGSSDD